MKAFNEVQTTSIKTISYLPMCEQPNAEQILDYSIDQKPQENHEVS